MSSLAATYNTSVDRNADWSKTLTIRDSGGVAVNIGSASFEGAIRQTASKPVVANFTFTLISSGTGGQVTIALTDTESLKLAPNQTYRYEISMTLSGQRYSLIKGTLQAKPNMN